MCGFDGECFGEKSGDAAYHGAMSAQGTCHVCGGEFPLARMDMAEHGYTCVGCAQQAIIRQHESAAAQALRDNNRAITLLAGLRFWSIAFHCAQCDAVLPRRAGILSVALPPRELPCADCGRACDVSFVHRVNWVFFSTLKLAVLLALALRYASVAAAIASASATDIVVELAIASVYAFIGAAVFAVPLTLIVDRAQQRGR